MAAHRELAQRLSEALHLGVPPVAVCLRRQALADPPPNVSQTSPSGCAFWQQATRRTLVTLPRDHRYCAIGMYTHNLEMTPAERADFEEALRLFAELGYLHPEEVSLIPVLCERPAQVLYAPLAASPLRPDVVLLFVQPGQALVLAEACQAADAAPAPVIGRPARWYPW